MARSHGCIKVEIWDDEEFTGLSKSAQWTYFMLISQPEINNLGILPYMPTRWVGFSAGSNSVKVLEADIAELEKGTYVLLDRLKCEICVRSFIKHDKVWAQPYLVKNARSIFRYVKSDRIKMCLRSRYPWLDDETTAMEIREYETSFPSQNKTPFEFRSKPLTDSDGVGVGPLREVLHFNFKGVVTTWLDHAPPLVKHDQNRILSDAAVKKKVQAGVERFGQQNCESAIAAYAYILGSPDYTWTHSWNIEDFFTRGLSRFIPEAEPTRNWRQDRKGGLSFNEIVGGGQYAGNGVVDLFGNAQGGLSQLDSAS